MATEKDQVKEENAHIIIEDNIMQFDKKIVQLSNVSCLQISAMPPKDYPLWAIIVVIAGVVIFTQSVAIGLSCIAIGGIAIALVYWHNSELEKYLAVITNSGRGFYFSCKNEDFLISAMEQIKACFNDNGKSVINFENCRIESSQIGTTNSRYEA